MGTEDVIDFYAGSWISGDRAAVRQLLSPEADIEWNLDMAVDDEELVQTLNRIALFADSVTVVAKVCNDEGAALVYDCAAPFGVARMAEFLTVTDGRITDVRQVYDHIAVTRFFPGLVEDEYGEDPYADED
jgi:ketosteroid isomerase-like protein